MERLTKSWGLYEDINVSELEADAELNALIYTGDHNSSCAINVPSKTMSMPFSIKRRKRSDSTPADILASSPPKGVIRRIETPDKNEERPVVEINESSEDVWQRMKDMYGLTRDKVTESVHTAFVALSSARALEAEKRFSEAYEKVENSGGYLLGIIRRLAADDSFDTSAIDDGVNNFPDSVRRELDDLRKKAYIDDETFDRPLIATFGGLAEEKQLEILEKYSEVDISHINNKRAFLKGICRRYSDKKEHWSDEKLRSAYASLHPYVFLCLESAFRDGKLEPDTVSPRALEKLCVLPVHVAIQCITKLQEADLSDVRNVTGFFLGIIKRHEEIARKQSEIHPTMYYQYAMPAFGSSYPPLSYPTSLMGTIAYPAMYYAPCE